MLESTNNSSIALDLRAISSEKTAHPTVIDVPKKYHRPGKPTKLHIWLLLAPVDYRPHVEAPPEITDSIYGSYEFLKRSAITYWNYFRQEHTAIAAELDAVFGEDMKVLKIDEKNLTSLYFNESCKDRISIGVAYADDKDKMYVRRG